MFKSYNKTKMRNETNKKPDNIGSMKRKLKRAERKGGRQVTTKEPRFKGRKEDSKGYIFNCSKVSSIDMFTDVLMEICIYLRENYRQGSDIRKILEKKEIYNITVSTTIIRRSRSSNIT